MGIAQDSKWRYHRKMNGFARMGGGREHRQLSHQAYLHLRVNHEDIWRKLHLADVDHAIGTVKEQVDLRTDWAGLGGRMAPGVCLHMNARYSKRRTNLPPSLNMKTGRIIPQATR